MIGTRAKAIWWTLKQCGALRTIASARSYSGGQWGFFRLKEVVGLGVAPILLSGGRYDVNLESGDVAIAALTSAWHRGDSLPDGP